MAECEEWGEKSRGQAENFGGQACVIVVIGGLGIGCHLGCLKCSSGVLLCHGFIKRAGEVSKW